MQRARRLSNVGCYSSIEEGHQAALNRAQEIEELQKQFLEGSKFGLSPTEKHKNFEYSTYVALEKLLRRKKATRKAYFHFLSCFFWFVVYAASLYVEKADVKTSNAVLRSGIDSLVQEISDLGVGQYGYTASKLGSVNYLQSSDVITWINSSIIHRVFVDPFCGDGICSDTEIQGIGRFGCSEDCGSFQNASTVTVNLQSFMRSSPRVNLDKWDISHVIPSMKADPKFRWNIYSKTFRDYVFESDLEEGDYSVDLLDGVYTLELYQLGQASLNVSAEDMYLNGYMVSSSIPPRADRIPQYDYGDYREFISASVAMMDAMYYYCYSSDVPRKPDKSEDMECRTFFDKSFGVQALSSYGLSGRLSIQKTGGGQEDLLVVPYCGVFPNGSLGLGGMRRVWNGREMVIDWVTEGPQGGADVNMPLLLAAQVPCSEGIDQASVNNMFRRSGRNPAARASPLSPKSRREAFRRGAVAFPPSAPTTMKTISGHGEPPPARTSPERHRLSRSSDAADGCTNGGVFGLGVEAVGPDARLGGPGYDEGLFWATVALVPLCGGNVARGVELRYALQAREVLEAQNGSGALGCEGGGGLAYAGPVFVSEPGEWVLRAVACSAEGRLLNASEVPLKLVAGPSMAARTLLGVQTGGGAVVELLQNLVCEALNVTDFCDRRVAVGQQDGLSVVWTALAETNKQAGEWRRLFVLNQSLLEGVVVVDMNVTVPVPLYRRHHVQQFCTSHYDCAVVAPARIGVNVMEVLPEDAVWGTGFCANYGSRLSDGRAPTCDYCQVYCMIESIDSFDGICPEHCGNSFSGKYPGCVSAEKLRETYTCDNKYTFEVRQFSRPNETMKDPRQQKTNYPSMITPSNNLIGGIILTQYRASVGPCEDRLATGVRNLAINYRLKCADYSKADGRPFGTDPTFAPSSQLFNGKHLAEDYYNLSTECFLTGQSGKRMLSPYGFFPHQWDVATGQAKNDSLVWKASVDEFKLYLDGRLSRSQALRLLRYIEDGHFFDEATAKLKVEMITYNADAQLFVAWTFVFDWHRTGDVSWNYALQIVDVEGRVSVWGSLLSGVAIFFFFVHLGLELKELYVKCRSVQLLQYVSSWFNTIDLLNFAAQAVAWVYWFKIRCAVKDFRMDESSYVLSDPEAVFRPFNTDAVQEFRLLDLIDKVSKLGDDQAFYSSIAGISIILSVFKLITALDFQPEMGLITATLAKAGSNLGHFLALYSIVFIGYSVVGNIMFGNLYAGMSTFGETCQTLMFLLLAFDPTQFYAQMNHAIVHKNKSGVQQGSMEYDLYIWSFMFINSYLLLNIFLAILVSAFQDVARSNEHAQDFFTDLVEIFSYCLKKMFLPARSFVSDDMMLEQLRIELEKISGTGWQETELNPRAAKVRECLAPRQVILVGRHGLAVEKLQISQLVKEVIASKKNRNTWWERFKMFLAEGTFEIQQVSGEEFSSRPSLLSVSAPGPQYSEGSTSQFQFKRRASVFSKNSITLIQNQYPATNEIMERFGVDMSKCRDEVAKALVGLLEIEGSERLLQCEQKAKGICTRLSDLVEHVSELSQSKCQRRASMRNSPVLSPPPAVQRMSSTTSNREVIASLEVTVMEAKELPRMDLFNSCDAYAVLFLNEEGSGAVATEYLQFFSQVQTTQVVTSMNPVWDEHFHFDITRATHSLVISVWDKEFFKLDELVGAVEINLASLEAFEKEGYFPLRNAENPARVNRSLLKLKLKLKRNDPLLAAREGS